MSLRGAAPARALAAVAAVLTVGPAAPLAAQGDARPGQSPWWGDTSGVPVPFARFQALVAANHPVAQQARLVAAQARSALREAWGAFDPKLGVSVSQKALDGKQYFTYVDAALKVPTPIGADVKLGFERGIGGRVAADRVTGTPGLVSLGVSLPIGQGLLTDDRRTVLAQARAFRDAGEAEQVGLVNKLLLDAAKAYGGWYAADRRYAIASEGFALATFRLEAVRERVRTGENPPVDTVEAALEVQRRAVQRLEAQVELLAARLTASNFLWDGAGRPLDLVEDARPVMDGIEATPPDTLRLAAWLDAAAARHPELRKAEGKLRAAEAERLLAAQRLIPFAEASFSSLAGRNDDASLLDQGRWGGNYKMALEGGSSLLFLKERGKAAGTAQKADFARWERDQVRREVALGIRIALNDVVVLERLLGLQRANLVSATLLRDAEQVRFLNGESTLLVVNLRERLVLDEAAKLAALEGKVAAARAALVVAVGDPALLETRQPSSP